MTDVTNQINQYQDSYGGSNLSNPDYYSSSRSLNLSSASNSIGNATGPSITTIPFTLYFADNVGLFGAENFYTKISLNILDTGNTYSIINDYQGTIIEPFDDALLNTYVAAVEDSLQDVGGAVNDFEPATRGAGFRDLIDPIIDIKLENVGTGNIYNDSHIDARLYDMNHNEIEDLESLISVDGQFYLGVHARNTRRLPYNIKVTIGDTVRLRDELTPEQLNLIIG